MLPLFKSLIRSKLEFCSELWNPYKQKDINKIEALQKSFTYRISGMQESNYWKRLKLLNLMSLQRRRERNIILFVWKIKNSVYPNVTNLQFKEHKRSNAIRAILKPLPKASGKIQTLFEESFLIKSAKLWNLLPAQLTRTTEQFSFKNGLRKFLENIPDKPPISGYPYTSNNSLLELCLYKQY